MAGNFALLPKNHSDIFEAASRPYGLVVAATGSAQCGLVVLRMFVTRRPANCGRPAASSSPAKRGRF